MKRVVLILALIIAVGCASAADVKIKDYPYFFVKDGLFNAKYVIGSEAPAIDTVTATILSTNLARYEDFKTAVGTSALDADISDIHNVNAIVIGDPCVNKAAWQLEGYPADCGEGLADSTGYVKIFSNGNKVQLLITGLSAEDRQVLGEKLAEGDLDNIDHDFFAYPTHTGSSRSKKILKQTAVANATVPSVTGAIVEDTVAKLETKIEQDKPKITTYARIDFRNDRYSPGFFGRIWNSIIKFFKFLF